MILKNVAEMEQFVIESVRARASESEYPFDVKGWWFVGAQCRFS